MSRRAISVSLLLSVLVSGTMLTEARGQEWSIDVSAGRIVYDPTSASAGTNNLMGTVRYDARRGTWV